MKARGATEPEIHDELRAVTGPGAGIWMMAQAGDHYALLESMGFGRRDWNGAFNGKPGVNQKVIVN
jgi:hypothetical protein